MQHTQQDEKVAPTHTSISDRRSMRAVVQAEYGQPEMLKISEIAVPAIKANEVLIEVHVAGVDRGVWHLMAGLPYVIRLAGYGVTRPKQSVPGLDVAGRVVAIGDDVTRFRIGDAVFGIGSGSFAEFAVAHETKLAHKPANLGFNGAGVAAISGITALQALTEVAALQPGQTVLVIGASGGVGSYAVQIAKALGGVVTGVASGPKVDMVRSLGADHVIDYTTANYLDGHVKYDIILDIGGRNPVRHLRKALTDSGTLVIVGGEDGGRWTGGVGRQLRAMVMSMFTKQRLTAFISTEGHVHIERLGQLISDGSVVPAIGERYPLEAAPSAIADLHAGRATGKSAVIVRTESADVH